MIFEGVKLKNPKISVVMSVYNGEKYLREAIESILKQTFSDFEFIIVNDGSTDSSLSIIQSYSDERIRLINNEKNIGLTKSLNKALKLAGGEYIARQDAEDISLLNRFEEQMKYFEKHPETALLGTSFYKINRDGEGIGKRIALANPGNALFKENQFMHGSVMFRKEVIDNLGGYNELIRYSQDYELWLRIAKHYQTRNLTKALYKFRYHDSNIRLTNWEESTLCHLLALRLTRNELGEEILKAINDSGIKSLHSYLSKQEKIYFHKVIADIHVHNNELKAAQEEYKKILSLNPFDAKTNINMVRSYLGKGVMSRSSKIYGTFRNSLYHLKNRWSR